MVLRLVFALGLLFGLSSPKVSAEQVPVFNTAKLSTLDAAINDAIARKELPGGVLWLERGNQVYHRAYGLRSEVPSAEAMTEDTIFDAASLTKVIATAPAIMLLAERGRLDLDAPVAKYLPDFAQNGKGEILVRHLLTHTGGLRSGIPGLPTWSDYAGAIERACSEPALSSPGSAFLYSDVDFILLGEIVQRVTGESLETFTAREIFGPLRMPDTGYLPPATKRSRIAPSEFDRDGTMLRGVVHDPTSRKMGGVAGHAGLFTTAADLARFARLMLHGGELDGTRILSAASVTRMISVQTPPETSRRGFGWDIDSAYSSPRGNLFPLGSYGHTGWTGTSLWIDPWSRTFIIFLSHRVHPDGKGDVVPLRRVIGTLAAEATGFDFSQNLPVVLAPRVLPDSGLVLNGIDVLVREHFIRLRGLRIGLVTNQTGIDRDRNLTIDLLHAAPDLTLVALFSPEHGIRCTVDDRVDDSVDEKTGLPIHSLYGGAPQRLPNQTDAEFDRAVLASREPKPEDLRDIDVIIVDLQDIGTRFYTYAATLGGVLSAAGKAQKQVIVLDRVDPIGGRRVEGPVQTRAPSFTGYHPIPVRYGMTLGELAKMFNAEREFGAELSVVACDNWKREMLFDETGLPWTNPSPNLRSFTAAMLYPGVCLLESTSLSMARGTEKPFEQVGAPFIDDVRFARELNAAHLVGVHFIPVRFTPRLAYFDGKPEYLKYRDEECGGVAIVVTDREQLHVVDIGIVMAQVLHRLYPQKFDLEKMDKLLGDEPTLAALRAGKSLEEIKALWAPGLAEFANRRNKFLLYPEVAR